MKKSYTVILVLIFIYLVNVVSVLGDEVSDLNNNAITYFEFEENNFDYIDNVAGINGSLGNVPTRTTGIINFGQDFETAGNQRITTTADNSLKASNPLISFWVKPESNPSAYYTITTRPGTTSFGWALQLRNTGDMRWLIFDGSNFDLVESSPISVGAGKWTHIAVYYSTGSDTQIWINGTKDNDNRIDNTANAINYPANTYQSFAGLYNGATWGDDGYDGIIDEIYYGDIDNTTISTSVEDLVTFLFNSGAPGSNQQYPFSSDVATITATLDYPVNETRYNDYNGTILINLSVNGSCELNDTRWIIDITNSTVIRFNNNTALVDGNYSIFAICNNTANTAQDNLTFWFYLDTVDPTITLYSPPHKSLQFTNFYVNVSYFDINLFRANTTIFSPNGTIIFNNYSGDLTTETTYNVTNLFNISGKPQGVYRLNMIASDSHTANIFDLDLDYTTLIGTTNTQYIYHMPEGNIEFKYPNDVQMETLKSPDRWLQYFTYDDDTLDEIEIEIEVDDLNDIIYLANSEYACHLILYNKYWYDCEGLDIIEFQFNNGKAVFKYHRNEESDISQSIGGLNIVEQNTTFEIIHSDSMRHFDINVPDIIVTDTDYEVVFNQSFNLTKPVELVFFGSAQLEKVAGPPPLPVDVDLRIIFNGVELLDQTIRTIQNNDDIGIVTLPIINATSVQLNNNLSIEMKISDSGRFVAVTGSEFHAFLNVTQSGQPITNIIGNINTDFTSTSYVELGNTSIIRMLNSSVYADIHHTVSADENNVIIECYAEVNSTPVIRTPIYTRSILSAGDTGSTGITVLANRFDDNWTGSIWCRSDSATAVITNNIKFYTFAMEGDGTTLILGNAVNVSNVTGVTGDGNRILNLTFTPLSGNETHVAFTIVAQSASGEQSNADSPAFTVNTTTPGLCNITYQRAFFTNDDIGTIKGYLDCSPSIPGTTYEFQMFVDVTVGESLDVLMAAMTVIDTTGQDITTGNVPPVTTITAPVSGSTVAGIIDINVTIVDINNDVTITNITLINFTNPADTTTILVNSTLKDINVQFNTSIVGDGLFYLTASTKENNTAENFGDTDTITFTIQNGVSPGALLCLDCLNSTQVCNTSLNFQPNSTGYIIQENFCGGDRKMEFVYLFFLAIMVFIAVISGSYIMEMLTGIMTMIFGLMVFTGDVQAFTTLELLNQGIAISIFMIGLYFVYIGVINIVNNRRIGKDKRRFSS